MKREEKRGKGRRSDQPQPFKLVLLPLLFPPVFSSNSLILEFVRVPLTLYVPRERYEERRDEEGERTHRRFGKEGGGRAEVLGVW